MKKTISGEDILLAIGDIDDDLLVYPAHRRTHYRIIKPLTLAASLIICITVAFSVFFSGILMKADKEDSAAGGDNFAPGDDGIMNDRPNHEDAPDSNGGLTVHPAVIIAYPMRDGYQTLHGYVLAEGESVAYVRINENGMITLYLPTHSVTATTVSGGTESITSDEGGNYIKYTVSPESFSALHYTCDGISYSVTVSKHTALTVKLTVTKEG